MSKEEAKKYKLKANAAFQDGSWDEAIFNYSKSINIYGSDHLCFSNRSAAYLKSGDYENALEDANVCISLKRDYAKGYGRKGSAYHAMQKYDHAIAAYKEGLKICKDDPHLLKGLAAAKTAKMENSKASKAVRKAEGTAKASQKRRDKAKKATTVSTFVEQTRRELKMQLAAIQAQLDLINELAEMTDAEKLDLLFGLIDRDGDGTIDASELATALRKRNQELTLKDSLERAIDMVAIFDTDGDAKLDYDEFSHFIDVMLKELGIDFHEFSEFLVLQILFKDTEGTEEEPSETTEHERMTGKNREEKLFGMLSDQRMKDLFMIFDKDGSRAVPFTDVATGLYQVSLEMDESVRKTMGLLLMMDKNDKRTLNYEQFGRLIMAIVAAADSTFDNISDDLMIALTRGDEIDPEALNNLLVTPKMRADAEALQKELKNSEDIITPLAYARLQKLFDLWDLDGNGDITLSELHGGLKKFQDASGIHADAKKEAMALLGFDEDGDNQLGRKEFAKAMLHYAKAYKVALQELLDFMCVTTVGKNTENFQKAYGKALIVGNVPDLKPANLNFVDDWGDTDDDPFNF